MRPPRLVVSIYLVALVQLLAAWLGFSLSRDYLIEPPHGGSVEVESHVGHGTAMHVHLPDALIVASARGTDQAHLGLRRASWAHTPLDG